MALGTCVSVLHLHRPSASEGRRRGLLLTFLRDVGRLSDVRAAQTVLVQNKDEGMLVLVEWGC